MSDNKKKLSPCERKVEKEARKILEMIKNNEFPRMVMTCNGHKRKELTAEELEISAKLIKERTEENERSL